MFDKIKNLVFPKVTKEEIQEIIKTICDDVKKSLCFWMREKEEKENIDIKKFFSDIKKDFVTLLEYLLIIKREDVTAKDFWIERIRGVKEIIEIIVFVIIALIIIRTYIFEIRYIPSESMLPTLEKRDRVIVENFSRNVLKQKPKRGDIMIFYPPSTKLEYTPLKVLSRLTGIFCDDIAYIKRVIGLPGEKFEIKSDENGRYTVYIDDEPLEENYVRNPYQYPSCDDMEVDCGPFIIPDGYYMMLGDNRGNSQDSRYWGPLREDRFIGKAIKMTRMHFYLYSL